MTFARPLLLTALTLTSLGCRKHRDRRTSDAIPLAESVVGDASAPSAIGEVATVHAAEASQPQWRAMAHGPRPRGVERWRFDLTPREALGAPATDGRTVFVGAAREEPEGPTDGEVYAFDLTTGSLRWHTPTPGLHGEPLEVTDGLVLVDTISHCLERGPDMPGLTQRRCRVSEPGTVLGLDATTGEVRFRTSTSSDVLRAYWGVVGTHRTWFFHDGTTTLRELVLPRGATGMGIPLNAAIHTITAAHEDLFVLVDGRRGTELQRRATVAPLALRPRWTRPLPFRGHCPLLVSASVGVVPAFASPSVSGSARAVYLASGGDVWSRTEAPQTVETCGALEGPMFYQVVNSTLLGLHAVDGRQRTAHPVRATLTSDLAAVMDGVFYTSARGHLSGLDVVGGHESVRVDTGAERAEGLVLWGGHGVVVTRSPGLVVGFE